MSNEAKFKAFMDKVLQRPLPTNPMARVRVLARELAEGAIEGIWGYLLITDRGRPTDGALLRYLHSRWNDSYPELGMLSIAGYLDSEQGRFRLTNQSLQLLEEIEPTTIFISYRRKDSSAFAMFVLTRLKMAGLNAYLDMAIPAGDDWQERIKAEIEKHDYFILLLGKETLNSSVVCQEIIWALQSGSVIIPIWHNEFEYKSGEFNVLPEIDEVLNRKNAIRVLEESALAYNNAIVELLNRFGITP